MNLAAALEACAIEGGWLQDTAFVAGVRSCTHGQVHADAARMTSLLAARGVGAGDRVLIALPDSVEFVWAFLGAVRLGAVAVPINPRLTAADHAGLAGDAGARLVVCGAALAGRFPGIPVLEAERLEGGLAAYGPHPAAPVRGRHPAYAQYTSGTTGRPKGALHAHGHPLTYFEAFARPAIALDRTDTVLSVSKLYFAYGLGNALFFPLLAGCRAVLHADHPRPDAVAALVRRHGVTVVFSVPTFYAHLVAGGQRDAMASVRVAVSAGEPLIPGLAARARAFLGCPILDGIGSTEVGQTFASNTLDRWRDGTVGRALAPYRVSVRDGDGCEVEQGEVGDLWVAGPTLPLGYLGPRTPPLDRHGEWLATGDRASLDGEGDLRLHGRADDMELVGGICVSPLEIEAVLSRHPAVTEVAVAGVVDASGASALQAFAVPSAEVVDEGALGHELLALAQAELAPFKVPRRVAFVASLPRTPTGKLRRFVLRRSGAVGRDPPADA